MARRRLPPEPGPVRALLVDDEVEELVRHVRLLLGAGPQVFGGVPFTLEVSNSAYFVEEELARDPARWDIIIADVFMQATAPKPPGFGGVIETHAERTTLMTKGQGIAFYEYKAHRGWSDAELADPRHGGMRIIDAALQLPEARRPMVILVSQFGKDPIRHQIEGLLARETSWLDYRDKAYWTDNRDSGVTPDIYLLALGQAIARLRSPMKPEPGAYPQRFVHSSPNTQEIEVHLRAIGATGARTAWISGERGVGRRAAARVLHEAREQALARSTPFVELGPTTVTEAEFERVLLGAREVGSQHTVEIPGAAQHAARGTIFIREIEQLRNPRQWEIVAGILRGDRLQRRDGVLVDTSDIALVVVASTDPAGDHLLAEFPGLAYELRRAERIRIPPLRERKKDIPLLAMQALQQVRPNLRLSPGAIQRLIRERWSDGNIDMLVRVVEHAAIRETVGEIMPNRIDEAIERTLSTSTKPPRLSVPPGQWAPTGVDQIAADQVLDAYSQHLQELTVILDRVEQAQSDEEKSFEAVQRAQPTFAVLAWLTRADLAALVQGKKKPNEVARSIAGRHYGDLTKGKPKSGATIKAWIAKRNQRRPASPRAPFS